jgi:hypothetical protein
MVGARWDVFDGGSRSATIEIGHAEVFQTQSRLHELLERVENEVRNAATALREARQLATDAERQAELSGHQSIGPPLMDARALAAVVPDAEVAHSGDAIRAAICFSLDRPLLSWPDVYTRSRLSPPCTSP